MLTVKSTLTTSWLVLLGSRRCLVSGFFTFSFKRNKIIDLFDHCLLFDCLCFADVFNEMRRPDNTAVFSMDQVMKLLLRRNQIIMNLGFFYS